VARREARQGAGREREEMAAIDHAAHSSRARAG
jgi:hypothetical protein